MITFPLAPTSGWIVTGVATLVLAFACWREIRRPNRHRLAGRLLAVLGALTALLALLLRPALPQPRTPFDAILVTPHASPGVVDSLRQAHPRIAVFALDTFPGATLLPHLRYLVQQAPHVKHLYVVGDGLTAEDRTTADSLETTFLLNPLPSGLVRLALPEAVHQGDTLWIEGAFHHPDTTSTALLLAGPEGQLDSLSLTAPGVAEVALRTVVQNPGAFLYTLMTHDATGQADTLGQVPVQVLPRQPLRIVILNDFPQFETRYLKAWLAQDGHQVAVRTRISRDRFQREFLNRPQVALTSLSDALLAETDLVMLDGASLQALSGADRTRLRRAVQEDGLGVWVTMDDAAQRRRWPLDAFTLTRTRAETYTPAQTTALPRLPYAVSTDLGTYPLLPESASQAVAAYRYEGLGKVGVSLLTQTYPLLLEGHTEAYRMLHTRWVQALAKSPEARPQWDPAWAFVDQPVALTLRQALSDTVPVGRFSRHDAESTPFYLAQDPYLPDHWHGTLWPIMAGWHQLALAGDTLSQPCYVFPASAWSSLQRAQRIRSNERYTVQRQPAPPRPVVYQPEPIAPIWPFLVLLGCLTFLWLEPKLTAPARTPAARATQAHANA
ncbi:hypothetical protein SAMN05421823_106296 [Catalinimonas alkaloidigena]|uniref:Uncharacterized protein n=1 Tax=Catalinimonas alkaloidigena TaxID=1075417 RepID=A0A1G9KZM4_9BACT|nr:hypothetical protein [Catalinimonas alkaloidigena]SDL55109.1 hypothetical protein SAMN05421823_106296 [Catalinimonas alkaloidigena]